MQKNTIKTKWDLSLLYKSINDPKIEFDIKRAEKLYLKFEKKYKKNLLYLVNEKELAKAISEYENIINSVLSKPLVYVYYLKYLDSKDEKVASLCNLLEQRLNQISNKIIFFEINISKVNKTIQNKYLTSPILRKHKYFLKKLFLSGKYILTEPEEKIISLLSLPSYSMWVDFLSKERSKQTVFHKNKEIPVSSVGEIIQTLPSQKSRVTLYKKLVIKNKELLKIAENELTAVITRKKIDDELRGYKEPFDSTIHSYEDDKETVLTLVKTVSDNFDIVHDFYKIKSKMLSLNKLKYPDRFANVGKIKKNIEFTRAYHELHSIFSNLDSEFAKILSRFAKNGQIDVHPKVGKRGGAFCSSYSGLPTYIFLNYTGSIDSLFTFAHEMGHGIHSEFSKLQPVLYEGYTISVAEVASTLFESFVFYEQFEKLSEKEKVIALHDKISDDVGTIFTQIAYFNFELELHNTIREKGSMTGEEMSEAFLRQIKSCFGPTFEFEKSDGHAFVAIPHFRSFFYVYTYAMGKIISSTLYSKYSKGKKYMEKIKEFLSLGGSMSPRDIFKSIGVDISKSDFWQEGLDNIRKDVEKLKKLVQK